MKIVAKSRFIVSGLIILFNTSILMIPAMILFRGKASAIIHHVNRLTLWMLGGRVKQYGDMDRSADLYLMNHQSVVDIIGMEALQNRRLRWVAKQELFEITWMGRVLKYAEMIPLDRSNKQGILKLLKDVKASKEVYKRPVALFPEGTRCSVQQLRTFKPGAAVVANKLHLRVQPVVITGSKHIFNEQSKTAHGGTLHLHFLPTIDLSTDKDPSWYETLQIKMQKVIDDELHHHHRSR